MQNHEKIQSIQELQTGRMHEAIGQAESVTVEFGTGSLPLFEAQDSVRFDSRNLYIGVNVDSLQHKSLAEKIEETGGFAVLGELSDDGLVELPIPAGSADVVFMGNVFGEPDSQRIMMDFQHADGKYRGNSDIDAKLRTAGQARELLKPDGHLVILETNTPYRELGKGRQPYAALAESLQINGFVVEDALDRKDLRWTEMVSSFATPDSWWSDASYLIVAGKLGEERLG